HRTSEVNPGILVAEQVAPPAWRQSWARVAVAGADRRQARMARRLRVTELVEPLAQQVERWVVVEDRDRRREASPEERPDSGRHLAGEEEQRPNDHPAKHPSKDFVLEQVFNHRGTSCSIAASPCSAESLACRRRFGSGGFGSD